MKPNELPDSCPADRCSDDVPFQSTANASSPSDAGARSRVLPKPLSIEAGEALQTDPFWVPLGVQLDGWSPALRNEIAMLINPIYNELVLNARPGLARSTGLTIVHLMWLEILDQIKIARAQQTADSSNDPLGIMALVSGSESRQQMIDCHLRVVHSKLKSSDFLLQFKKFNAGCRPQRKSKPDTNFRKLSARRRRPRKTGKNDFC